MVGRVAVVIHQPDDLGGPHDRCLEENVPEMMDGGDLWISTGEGGEDGSKKSLKVKTQSSSAVYTS